METDRQTHKKLMRQKDRKTGRQRERDKETDRPKNSCHLLHKSGTPLGVTAESNFFWANKFPFIF
jgi:hypothetical protein